jgi:hypothetical protein
VKKILIVGAPRSGTTYLSRIFSKVYDIDVRKERCGENGGVGYNLVYHDMRAKKDHHNHIPMRVRDCFLVGHVVRDPRRCIPSMNATLLTQGKRAFGWHNSKECSHFNPTYGNLENWWLYHNAARCEGLLNYAQALGIRVITFRIEDSDGVVPVLLREFGVEDVSKYRNSIPKDTNHAAEYERLEWEDLPKSVVTYARRWYS